MPGQVEVAASYCCSTQQDLLLLTKQDCEDACNSDDNCLAFSWKQEQVSWSYIFADCNLYDATALSAVDDVVGSRALSPPQGDGGTSCYVKLPYSTASLSCEDDTLLSPATPPPSPAPLAPLATPVPDADSLNATLPWGPTAVLRIRIDGATYRPDLLNIGDIGIYREVTPDGACTALEPTPPPPPPSPPPPLPLPSPWHAPDTLQAARTRSTRRKSWIASPLHHTRCVLPNSLPLICTPVCTAPTVTGGGDRLTTRSLACSAPTPKPTAAPGLRNVR